MTTTTKAPEFELTSHKGDKIQLSETLKNGPVVLAFFPLAFTGVCTEEMCEFRDAIADFQNLKAQVFGISVDSRFALAAFAEKQNLTFPLLSDFNKQVARDYGVLNENFLGMHGVAKRSVFVIDREGQIRFSWISEDAKVKPDQAAVKNALKDL